MAIKLTKKQPVAVTTKEMKDHGKTVSEDKNEESTTIEGVSTVASTPWCEVGVEASYTHNLGDYKSARVQVSLMIPCPHEEINKTFDIAKGWVDKRIQTMIDEITSE